MLLARYSSGTLRLSHFSTKSHKYFFIYNQINLPFSFFFSSSPFLVDHKFRITFFLVFHFPFRGSIHFLGQIFLSFILNLAIANLKAYTYYFYKTVDCKKVGLLFRILPQLKLSRTFKEIERFFFTLLQNSRYHEKYLKSKICNGIQVFTTRSLCLKFDVGQSDVMIMQLFSNGVKD